MTFKPHTKTGGARPPFKGAAITDVTFDIRPHSSQHALACVFTGNRYHVWLEEPTFELAKPVIYKNPPLDLKPSEPGYFTTRKLSTEKGLGRWLVQVMREEFISKNLLEKARQRVVEQEAAAERERAALALRHRKEEAAEELYCLLEAYAERFAGLDPALEARVWSLLMKIKNGS